MRRTQRHLLAIAVLGWLGATVSQLLAFVSPDNTQASRWRIMRNRCLLISSICMNSLVLSVVYQYVRKIGRQQRQAEAVTDNSS